ncbi:MAG: glycosyltransferase family 4 protein [Chloroflexi bacterium]|nr:MAG: glycosyltransferase family 4 protein [Chloroflexota bacterium]
MHIAFFTNTYVPVMSGVVQSIRTFRNSLVEQGHNVFIFAQHAEGYKDTEPFVFRYPAISLPMQQKYPVIIPLSPRVDWLMPALKLDVIHSHHPFLLGQAAAAKAADLGVPLVFTYHTRYRAYSHYVPFNQKLVKTAIEDMLAEYMKKCHHIVVPSESIKQILSEVYGIREQMTAIPTGMDLSLWENADGPAVRRSRGWGQDTVLISVGRLAKEKNWPTLIRAAAQVIRHRAGVRLCLIGDGDERRKLEALAAELGVAERVEFTGNIPYRSVIAHLKAADLFCFASESETQGMVTMEAMAAGLPVVAVDATGTRDVVTHGHEGLLTPNHSNALAQAIETVLNDDSARARFAGAALARAQTLSIQAQAKKLVDVYRQAAQDQRAGRYVQITNPDLAAKRSARWLAVLENMFEPDKSG